MTGKVISVFIYRLLPTEGQGALRTIAGQIRVWHSNARQGHQRNHFWNGWDLARSLGPHRVFADHRSRGLVRLANSIVLANPDSTLRLSETQRRARRLGSRSG